MSTLDRILARRAAEIREQAIADFLTCPAAQSFINPTPVGPNAHRSEHGGVDDRSYIRRLAARGERDES